MLSTFIDCKFSKRPKLDDSFNDPSIDEAIHQQFENATKTRKSDELPQRPLATSKTPLRRVNTFNNSNTSANRSKNIRTVKKPYYQPLQPTPKTVNELVRRPSPKIVPQSRPMRTLNSTASSSWMNKSRVSQKRPHVGSLSATSLTPNGLPKVPPAKPVRQPAPTSETESSEKAIMKSTDDVSKKDDSFYDDDEFC